MRQNLLSHVRLFQPPHVPIVRSLAAHLRPALSFDVWHLNVRYAHHAGPSGYDILSAFLGQQVKVANWLYWAGETLLRPWAVCDARLGGQFEYSRYDWVRERALMTQMRATSNGLFHVLYGEKSYRHAWKLVGRNGNRLVATLHHPQEHYSWLFRSTRHLRYLSHAIVMSQSLKGFAETLVGPSSVSVVPYGVDTEYFVPASGAARGAHTLVFAGFHERDYDTLRCIVEVIVRATSSVKVVLISRDERCVAIARSYPDRVVQVAGLSDAEYRRALQASDLMILPLRKSVAVTAVLEAMACGVPVLTTAGGISDYVVPEGGAVFGVGDAEGMAAAAIELLTDEDRLARAKAGARRQAEQFAWPLVAERTADVYRRVMAG